MSGSLLPLKRILYDWLFVMRTCAATSSHEDKRVACNHLGQQPALPYEQKHRRHTTNLQNMVCHALHTARSTPGFMACISARLTKSA